MALGSDTSTKYDRVVFLQNVKSLLQNVSALLKRDPNTDVFLRNLRTF